MLHVERIEISGNNIKYGTLYGPCPYIPPSKGSFRLRMSHGNQTRQFSLKNNENVQEFELKEKILKRSKDDQALRFELQKQSSGILMTKWDTICERKLKIEDILRNCEGEMSWTSSIQLRSKEAKSKMNAFVRIKYKTNKERTYNRVINNRGAPPPPIPVRSAPSIKSVRMCRNETGRLGFVFNEDLRIVSVSEHASRYGMCVGQRIRRVETIDVRNVSELASAVEGLMWITFVLEQQNESTRKDITICRDNKGRMGIDFNGLKIVSVSEHARKQGVCVGYSIVAIDGTEVSNSSDVKNLIKGKTTAVLTVSM